jgi:DNA-binding transcriptional LysR family regulator
VTPIRLTVGYVPGVTPAKWARTWAERQPQVPLQLQVVAAADAVDALLDGTIDVALLRPPGDMSGVAAIPLYEETTVVVVPTDHLFGAVDAVTVVDLDGEPILVPLDDVVAWTAGPGIRVDHRPETTREAMDLVAAGMGMLVVPQSLARLHHRRDLIYRPITDAPTCPVALAVPAGPYPDLVEEFIGIVRGRTASSSRGQAESTPKRTAREKTLAKQAARAAAGKVAHKPGQGKRGRR